MGSGESGDPYHGAIRSDQLLGLVHRNCPMSYCRSPIATSTGWLVPGLLGWAIEFDCPEHGLFATSGGEFQKIIDQVLTQHQPKDGTA